MICALVAKGMTAAEPAGQTNPPVQKPLSVEEKRIALERLVQQIQKERGLPQTASFAAPAPPAEAPATAPAAPQRPIGAAGPMVLNYDNADLYDFVNQIADQIGYTPLVIDPEVKGSVTIHSTVAIAKDDIVPLFHLILKNNNVALVKQGNIYQVVPISSALKRGVEIIDLSPQSPPASPPKPAPGPTPAPASGQPGAAAPAQPAATSVVPMDRIKSGRLSTYIVRAEFVPVKDLVDPLKLFMTDGGVIMPYDRLNMLIITDYGESVSKLVDIVRLFDDNFLNPDLVELIKIKSNAANDVLDDLKKIFGSGAKDSPTGIYFVSLERLNSILVMANSKRALEEVKRWIAKLDETTGRSVQTFVYTVENSTAANISMILSALYGGEVSGSTTGGAGSTAAGTVPGGVGARTVGGATGGMVGGAATPFGNTGSYSGGGMFGGGYSGATMGSTQGMYGGGGGFGGGMGGYGGGFMGIGSQLGPRLGGGPSMSTMMLRGGAFTGLQDVVRIVADDINNTLIIQASQADYSYLLETIKKIDVLPRQAIIDARIFEVDLNDQLNYGVSANLQARSTDPHLTTAGIAASSGALSAGTFAFVGNSREILANINALRSKTKVRILEAPSVLALDGTMAQIVVGGEVPYRGASYISGAGGSTSSVQYRDTGISLIVMPRISASGTVTLQIAQEISSPGSNDPNLGPTFNKTSVSTTLAVKDGETVAIAGLIRTNNSSARNGVPFFSEIPLLGSLFGQTNHTALRTEVLILITPHVIRNPERFQEMSQELQDSLRNVRKLVTKAERDVTKEQEHAEKERTRREEKEQKQSPPPPDKPQKQ